MFNKIYLLNVKIFDNKELFDYWYNIMPKERQDKISKYIYLKDKKLSLGAGLLLYNGLKKLNIQGDIIYNKNGKPYLLNHQIYFNISHFHDLVVCVFSDKEVGVDIASNLSFDEQIIKNIYNDEEIEYIKNKDNIWYTKLWTMKESFMKYLGEGILLAPKTIHIDLARNRIKNNNKVYLTNIILEDYSLTICSEYEDFPKYIENIHLIKEEC